MRISDWSSDVCSSDLCKHGFSSEPVAQRSPEQSAQRPHEKGYRECRQREQGRLACGAGEQSCGYIGQAIGIDAIIEPFGGVARSEEHTSELQSLMRISYAVFCLKKKKNQLTHTAKIQT